MLRRLGYWLRLSRHDTELAEELAVHREMAEREFLRQGMSPAAARDAARRLLGNETFAREESRGVWLWAWLEAFSQDARYALRGLRAHPVFTAGVALTLALGVGANAAMFGITDRLLFRAPAFLRDEARTHRVYETWKGESEQRTTRNMQFARYLDFLTWTHDFSVIAAFQTRQLAVGDGVATREVPVTAASASYFDFFDAPPALGRYYTAQEDRVPTGTPVVVLGYEYWQSQYGGRADVLGRTLHVSKTLIATIIGVTPEGFHGMADQGVPAMYLPISAFAFDQRGASYPENYNWSWLEVIALRKPEVTRAQAEADFTAAFQRSWTAMTDIYPNWPSVQAARPRVILGPVQFNRGPLAGRDARVVTWVLGVALIVLLVSCANVANLLLSRAVSRRREMVLRLALGVSRGRLIRQLLTESFVLTALGGIAGVLVAQFGGRFLGALFLEPGVALDVVTDTRTLIVAALAMLAATLLTGVAPAVNALRSDLALALSSGARDTGGGRSSLRTLLLLFQATLSVVLLVGAGLFIRSLSNVRAMRLGYDVDPILIVSEQSRGVKMTNQQLVLFEQQLAHTAAAIPGVEGATPAPTIPFWSNEGRALFVQGIDSVDKLGNFILQAASPDYFRIMGTRVPRGRIFDAGDRATSPPVAIVSEGMAKLLWPGRDAIGQCFRIGRDTMPCTRVVGVAEDMKARAVSDSREYTYYVPLSQYPLPTYQLIVRVRGDAADFAEVVRRRLQAQMPGDSYVQTMPFRRVVDPNLRAWQFGATMFTAFGGLALLLAAVGMYSVIAYGVVQRRQEIGVRIALGARRADIIGMVVGNGLRVVIVGTIAGAGIARLAGRWVAELLFQESPNDPVVYGAVACALVVVALVATALPAMRAARLDPNAALRAE